MFCLIFIEAFKREGPAMLRVDEKVAVAVNQGGEPIGFSWRGGNYLVSAKPVRWFARREWWIEAARVQRGIGAGVLEVEMWRLQASSSKAASEAEAPRFQYELVHTTENNLWKLVRVYS
jgi:hypothetical protein